MFRFDLPGHNYVVIRNLSTLCFSFDCTRSACDLSVIILDHTGFYL